LINFGGAISTPSEEGAAETIAAWLNTGAAERFLGEVVNCDFSRAAAASAASSKADLTGVGVPVTTGAEGFDVSKVAVSDTLCNPGLVCVVEASLVCGDVPESVWTFAVF